jgi:hypothetical protein
MKAPCKGAGRTTARTLQASVEARGEVLFLIEDRLARDGVLAVQPAAQVREFAARSAERIALVFGVGFAGPLAGGAAANVLHGQTLARSLGFGRVATWPLTLGLFAFLAACRTTGQVPAQAFHGPDAIDSPNGCPAWSTLAFGLPVYASSVDTELVLSPTCVPKASHGCAYEFELHGPQRVKLSLLSEDFDGALALFGEDGQRSGELACVEDTPQGDPQHARIERVLRAGRYVAFVTAPLRDSGHFELFAEREPVPSPAEYCAAASSIAPGEVQRGTTEGGYSRVASACSGGDGPDRAFRFELGERARVRLHQHTTHDGILSLRRQLLGECEEIACSDDHLDGEHAQIMRTLDPGTYVVVTDSYGTMTSGGTYALSYMSLPEPIGPALAERCQSARPLPLDGSPIAVDTFDAPSQTHGTCTEGDAPETLFGLSLSSRALVTLSLEQADFQAALYLRSVCTEGASELDCGRGPRSDRAFSQDTGPVAPHDLLVVDLEAGDYVLAVDGATPHAMGSAILRARFVSGVLPAL